MALIGAICTQYPDAKLSIIFLPFFTFSANSVSRWLMKLLWSDPFSTRRVWWPLWLSISSGRWCVGAFSIIPRISAVFSSACSSTHILLWQGKYPFFSLFQFLCEIRLQNSVGIFGSRRSILASSSREMEIVARRRQRMFSLCSCERVNDIRINAFERRECQLQLAFTCFFVFVFQNVLDKDDNRWNKEERHAGCCGPRWRMGMGHRLRFPDDPFHHGWVSSSLLLFLGPFRGYLELPTRWGMCFSNQWCKDSTVHEEQSRRFSVFSLQSLSPQVDNPLSLQGEDLLICLSRTDCHDLHQYLWLSKGDDGRRLSRCFGISRQLFCPIHLGLLHQYWHRWRYFFNNELIFMSTSLSLRRSVRPWVRFDLSTRDCLRGLLFRKQTFVCHGYRGVWIRSGHISLSLVDALCHRFSSLVRFRRWTSLGSRDYRHLCHFRRPDGKITLRECSKFFSVDV